MIDALAAGTIIGSVLLLLISVVTAIRNRPMGMVLLVGLAVLEVALLVQAGIGLARLGELAGGTATFIGYLLGTAVIPPLAVFWGLGERSRWGPAVIAVGCFAVAVMVGRLIQIWQGTA